MIRVVTSFVFLCSLAFHALGQSPSPVDDGFDKLIVEAYTSYTQQKYSEALAASQKAAALRPTDNRPYAISGVIHLSQWKVDEASALFALAIRFSPKNPVLHYMKARADRFRGEKEEGLLSVRKAIEIKPDYAEAYLLLGDLLTKDDERTAAFRRALELDPKLLNAYVSLGMQLEDVKKDRKAAEEAFKTAMEVDPQKMAGRFHLGRLLVEDGRLTEARTLWKERTSDEDRTFPNFITVLERAEKLDAAKREHARAPDNAEANLQLGLATMDGDSWVVDGRWERAIVYFRRALELKPDYSAAQYGICKAYVEMADLNKDKNKVLDKELAKLRKLDPMLADDIVEYRRTYSGGLKAAGPPPAKKN